jgi:acyl-homoserine-lactone acylase
MSDRGSRSKANVKIPVVCKPQMGNETSIDEPKTRYLRDVTENAGHARLPRRRLRKKRVLVVMLVVVALLLGWSRVRRWLVLPKPPRPDAATFAQAERVRIVRDPWGVPHVRGKSDADAAFGLAYANSEDDWPTIQAVIAAAQGRLSLLFLSKTALANDYYVSLVRVKDQVAAEYDALDPAYRELLESYARGLNLYAWLHPEEADGRLFPLSGRDIAAGFAHKIPLMFDIGDSISAVTNGAPKHAGEKVLALSERDETRTFLPGSNAHAVAASRSADGVARLNVNSHQPWEGPVAWYEAQVTSDEGWNMTGGLFPGAPIVLHGHNDHLGWAHTVNTPDLVDVYELSLDPNQPDTYLVDGEPKALEVRQAPITIDTGIFDITVHKPVYWSIHGPVMKNERGGAYAFRYAGMGRALKAGEQWYRMNKARSFDEWKAAMRMQAIPMFNTVYADRENIFYVYNALIPVRRDPSLDWTTLVPGNRRELVWTEYLPFDELPQVENPSSGFVQNCNSTPFQTTTGEGNPRPEGFAKNTGIETDQTNRAARSLTLLGGDDPLTRADFLRMKWDQTYGPDAKIRRTVVKPLLAERPATTDAEREALDVLAEWNGVADPHSPGATIAILTWHRVDPKASASRRETKLPLHEAFRDTVRFLLRAFGSVRVPWGEVHRLRRGTIDLPLGGGPDVINGIVAKAAPDRDRITAFQGDSFVMLVEFGPRETTSMSVHQYGASCRPTSPHYADQAPHAVKHELKPTLRKPDDLAAAKTISYRPGERHPVF